MDLKARKRVGGNTWGVQRRGSTHGLSQNSERRWAPPSLQAHCKDMKTKRQKITMPDRSRPGLTTTAQPIAAQDGRDKLTTGPTPQIDTQRTKTRRLTNTETVIGTWNVRTLNACGKTRQLTHALEPYRWDIIGLSEVRWKGIGEARLDEGHKIWFSGDENYHQHGVAIMVRKELVSSVISCTPVSSRIISIRTSAKPHNLTIIQVYAPTTDHADEEVEEFYEQLENTIAKVPKKDITLVVGDWNAKVGTDSYKDWSGTVGRFGTGQTNARGLRLLEFGKHHQLTLANTLHPQKISRRTTWHAPNGKVHNRIDFILAPQRFKSSINKAKTRSFPGADIGSDHDLVMTTLKLKLRANKCARTTRIHLDLEKLKDPRVAEAFQAQVGGKFAALSLLNSDIDTLANNITSTLISSAEEVLGKKRHKNQPWVTDEVLELCDRRRELRHSKYESDEARMAYRTAHRKVQKGMREAKERWIEKQCNAIDTCSKSGNSKEAYSTLKAITKTSQARTTVIEDKNGLLLTESNDIAKRWTEYCRDLYNHNISTDPSLLTSNDTSRDAQADLPVLREEVEAAIKTLKPGKSPGVDNVPSELIKHGGESTVEALSILCKKVWHGKRWPSQWTQSLVIPLPKKGNLKQCQNYRTISLISHPSKVMLRILLNRLKAKAEEILSEEQAGFRAGRSTVEQIFNCRLMIEKHLQHQKDIHHNFIDFKKAFDRVWHEGLWKVLRDFNVDEGLVQLLHALYDNSSSAVLINNEVGEFFRTTVGVRQGCILSPVLFNIFLERIMQDTLSEHSTSISVGGRSVCNLRFADDIDLMAGSNEELQDLTNRLTNSANAYGMEVSAEKSKIMVNSRNNRTSTITMNGTPLEQVNHFKYLGATLSSDGSSTADIRIRLATATSAMAKLKKIWSSRISFTTKYRLYKSLVLSVLLYGCEAWTLLAETERRLEAFEYKCLRRLLQISYTERKTNDYVRETVHDLVGSQEPLLATIKRRKLAWYGHVTRHDSLCKTILQGTVEGGRCRGRQRKSWSDNVKEWTNLSTPELLIRAADRHEWRKTSASSAFRSPRRSTRSRDE